METHEEVQLSLGEVFLLNEFASNLEKNVACSDLGNF